MRVVDVNGLTLTVEKAGEGGVGMIPMEWLFTLVVVVVALFFLGSFIRIVPEYERVIIFRLGRRTKAIFNPGGDGNGPGLVLLVPLIDKIVSGSACARWPPTSRRRT